MGRRDGEAQLSQDRDAPRAVAGVVVGHHDEGRVAHGIAGTPAAARAPPPIRPTAAFCIETHAARCYYALMYRSVCQEDSTMRRLLALPVTALTLALVAAVPL